MELIAPRYLVGPNDWSGLTLSNTLTLLSLESSGQIDDKQLKAELARLERERQRKEKLERL